MKTRLLVIFLCLFGFTNLANSQEQKKLIDMGKPSSREIITPGEMPKTIIIKEGTKWKELTIDTMTPGLPVTDIKVIKGPKGEIDITFAPRKVPFRPDVVQYVGRADAMWAVDTVMASEIYPMMESGGWKMATADFKLAKYEKQEFDIIFMPLVKKEKKVDSFVALYKFAEKEKIILFNLLEKSQIELVDGTTGEKTLLKLPPEGQIISSITIPQKSQLYSLLISEAYAVEWKGIVKCIVQILKKTPDWGPACGWCATTRFRSPTCKVCLMQLAAIVGDCYLKIGAK